MHLIPEILTQLLNMDRRQNHGVVEFFLVWADTPANCYDIIRAPDISAR